MAVSITQAYNNLQYSSNYGCNASTAPNLLSLHIQVTDVPKKKCIFNKDSNLRMCVCNYWQQYAIKSNVIITISS